ncbi:hypothetical protein T439DRAFT_104612 [Meredithblackwellia eburnea MCA 4105]
MTGVYALSHYVTTTTTQVVPVTVSAAAGAGVVRTTYVVVPTTSCFNNPLATTSPTGRNQRSTVTGAGRSSTGAFATATGTSLGTGHASFTNPSSTTAAATGAIGPLSAASHSALSKGAIAGISVAAILGAVALVVLVLFFLWWSKKKGRGGSDWSGSEKEHFRAGFQDGGRRLDGSAQRTVAPLAYTAAAQQEPNDSYQRPTQQYSNGGFHNQGYSQPAAHPSSQSYYTPSAPARAPPPVNAFSNVVRPQSHQASSTPPRAVFSAPPQPQYTSQPHSNRRSSRDQHRSQPPSEPRGSDYASQHAAYAARHGDPYSSTRVFQPAFPAVPPPPPSGIRRDRDDGPYAGIAQPRPLRGQRGQGRGEATPPWVTPPSRSESVDSENGEGGRGRYVTGRPGYGTRSRESSVGSLESAAASAGGRMGF